MCLAVSQWVLPKRPVFTSVWRHPQSCEDPRVMLQCKGQHRLMQAARMTELWLLPWSSQGANSSAMVSPAWPGFLVATEWFFC